MHPVKKNFLCAIKIYKEKPRHPTKAIAVVHVNSPQCIKQAEKFIPSGPPLLFIEATIRQWSIKFKEQAQKLIHCYLAILSRETQL